MHAVDPSTLLLVLQSEEGASGQACSALGVVRFIEEWNAFASLEAGNDRDP